MNWFKKVMGGPKPVEAFSAPLAPDQTFLVVGDIHGHFDALETLLDRIESRDEVMPVICVGDYVDRGDQSAHVLTWIKHLNTLYPDLFIALKGNHEQMMLDFIKKPEATGERWLRYGGLQTLMSFRIGRAPGESMISLRDRLVEELGPEMIAWLKALPLQWQSGNVVVCHAGMDPTIEPSLQSQQVLLWGHEKFGKHPRQDGVWVVHGHTIVDEPVVQDGVISIDTGAYATGVLTAVEISATGPAFITSKG